MINEVTKKICENVDLFNMSDIFSFIESDFVRPFTVGSAWVGSSRILVVDVRLKRTYTKITDLFGVCLSVCLSVLGISSGSSHWLLSKKKITNVVVSLKM